MNIGFIGSSSFQTTALPENCAVYSYDPSKPLQLTVSGRGKKSVIRELEGYFYPLGEMMKRVDGPVFISVPADLLDVVFGQLDEAVVPPLFADLDEDFSPVVVLDSSVPSHEVERLKSQYRKVEVHVVRDFSSCILTDGTTTVFDLVSRKNTTSLPLINVGWRDL